MQGWRRRRAGAAPRGSGAGPRDRPGVRPRDAAVGSCRADRVTQLRRQRHALVSVRQGLLVAAQADVDGGEDAVALDLRGEVAQRLGGGQCQIPAADELRPQRLAVQAASGRVGELHDLCVPALSVRVCLQRQQVLVFGGEPVERGGLAG